MHLGFRQVPSLNTPAPIYLDVLLEELSSLQLSIFKRQLSLLKR